MTILYLTSKKKKQFMKGNKYHIKKKTIQRLDFLVVLLSFRYQLNYISFHYFYLINSFGFFFLFYFLLI